MFNLSGKVALVTGASSGIGRAAAIALASQGAKVAIAARRIDRLNELAKELVVKEHEALPLQLDVTKKDQIDAGIAKIIKEWGRLDILVNNAGIGKIAPFLDMTEALWDEVIHTNLKGAMLVAQACAREMVKNKWGRIINISSILSGGVGSGFPTATAYASTKGALVSFTESLADELAAYRILVNAIGPGFIKTEMTEQVEKNPEMYKALVNRIPLKRFGTPEEIASLIVYLASDESSYTTGSTFYVDGGWLAS